MRRRASPAQTGYGVYHPHARRYQRCDGQGTRRDQKTDAFEIGEFRPRKPPASLLSKALMTSKAPRGLSSMPRRSYLRWLGGCTGLLLPQLLGTKLYAKQVPGVAAHATKRRSLSHFDSIIVKVAALDTTSQDLIAFTRRCVLRNFPVSCEADTSFAAQKAPPRIDGRFFFESRFQEAHNFPRTAQAATIELWLTGSDIVEAGRPFVFALTSVTDRVALISTARIRSPHRGQFLARLNKLIVHEVGHAFGLEHHQKKGCVMRVEPTVRDLDSASAEFCSSCQTTLQENIARCRRKGQLVLDQALANAARGHRRRALRLAQRLQTLPQIHPDIRAQSGAFAHSLQNPRYSAQGTAPKADHHHHH